MIIVKNSEQIILMKKAGVITAEALLVAKDLIRPGISTKEIDSARDGEAIGGKTVAEHEAVEAPAEDDAEEDTETDTKHNAVEKGENESKLCVADTLDKRTASSHDGKRGEHPKNGGDEGLRHCVHCGVI